MNSKDTPVTWAVLSLEAPSLPGTQHKSIVLLYNILYYTADRNSKPVWLRNFTKDIAGPEIRK